MIDVTAPPSGQFIYGAILGVIVGAVIGFYFGRKFRNGATSTKRLTQLQMLSVLMFFGYQAFSRILDQPVSEFIAIAILSLTGGEALGVVLEKIFEKGKK